MEVKENIKVWEKQVISENNSNESKKVTKNEEKNEENLKEDKPKVQNNISLWGNINYII